MKYNERVQKWNESMRTTHMDADEGDGHWVTTKEGNHMFINGEGEPTKGNPHVLAAAKGEAKTKVSSGGKPFDLSNRKVTSSVGKISDPESKYTPPKSDRENSSLYLANGSNATEEDMIDALAYLHGKSASSEKVSLRNGDYTKAEIQRALNYHSTKGLPQREREELYAQLNRETGVEKKSGSSSPAGRASDLNSKVQDAWDKKGPKRSSGVIAAVEKSLNDMENGMTVEINGAKFEKIPEGFKDTRTGSKWKTHVLMDMVNPGKDGKPPVFSDPSKDESSSSSPKAGAKTYTVQDDKAKTTEFNKAMRESGEDAAAEILDTLPTGTVLEGETAYFKKGGDGKWQMSQDGENYDKEQYPHSFAAMVCEAGHTNVILPKHAVPDDNEASKSISEPEQSSGAANMSHESGQAGTTGDYTPKDSRKKTADLKKALKSGGEDALGEALYDLPTGAVLHTPDYTFRKNEDGEWEMSTDGKNYEEGGLPDSYAAHEFASGVSSVTLPSKTPPTAKDLNEEMKRAYKKNDSRWVYHEAKKALLSMPAGGKVYTNEETFTKTEDGGFADSEGNTIGMSPMLVQFSIYEDEAPVFYDPE